jgi:hypothetical protein
MDANIWRLIAMVEDDDRPVVEFSNDDVVLGWRSGKDGPD